MQLYDQVAEKSGFIVYRHLTLPVGGEGRRRLCSVSRRRSDRSAALGKRRLRR